MNNSSDTKVCPMCAETIKAAAKACPFCQSRQNRFVIWGFEYAVVLMGAAMMAMAIGFFAWFAPDEKDVGGRNFARHRNDLAVFDTTLGRGKAEREFWLTGVVTNRGEYPWRVHELEVRFLDNQGVLLDVKHRNVKVPFVTQSRQEHAFRVELGNLVFTNDTVVQQVRVQTATDGDRPLKPD